MRLFSARARKKSLFPLLCSSLPHMGASGNNLLQVLFRNFDVLALPFVTLVYPLHASIRAIETRSHTHYQQWLTYWVLYSLMTLFEITFAKVLQVLPIWPYAKLIFSCWLVLPQFNGAATVYGNYIRPFYMNPQIRVPQASQMWCFPRKNNIFNQPDDVLTAAERYMNQHGTEAFERLITKNERVARAKRNRNHVIYDDDYMY
ncbi:HVA22-like protein c [Arachis hypogaea]|nr:HVA22-like protein c [Arachis hypogaea]